MRLGRLGAKGARLASFILSGVGAFAPIAPSIVVFMRAAGGPVLAVQFQGPAQVYAVYANGLIDQAINAARSGLVSWTNPNAGPIVGSTFRPGQRKAPNVLGSQLGPGPQGISAVAVYFDDAGGVRGVQFNGPATVEVRNVDGSRIVASNAQPSGSPAAWANQ